MNKTRHMGKESEETAGKGIQGYNNKYPRYKKQGTTKVPSLRQRHAR